MGQPKPTDTDEHDDDTADEHDDDTAGDADAATSGPVAEAFRNLREDFSNAIDRLTGQTSDDDEGDDDVTTKTKPPAADDADATEAKVRAALAKVRTEEAIQDRLAKVEEAAKKIEAPPRKKSWLEKAVWG